MDRYIEFIGNHVELHLALVAILGVLAWSYLGNRISGYRKVEPAEAVRLLNNEGGVVVDIRDHNEFKQGHIKNAVHIPVTALNKRHVELAKFKSKPVIVACRSGAKASTACNLLRKQGFESVHMLAGGMLSWESANLPTTRK